MAFIHPGTHCCCALEGPPGKRSTSGCQYDAWPGIRALSNLYPGFSAIVHLPDSNARASRSSPFSTEPAVKFGHIIIVSTRHCRRDSMSSFSKSRQPPREPLLFDGSAF